ncbi:sugar ABC transporter ATP-binding protein [Verminephrobacter eiseniae]|uniref:sugar ABC transporter ATP-binding protein n=1 Tax=Verminephrobacter eiseniae TaxID=364317 RepID=UPI002236F43A|nr:sugar ABC transporter ATP-binding protein [Verminephrobacter eiseniae]
MRKILEFQALNKRFGGTHAVNDITFDIREGEVLALLGENGAGKSTLIKLLAGIYPSDSGEILFDGRPQSRWRSNDRSKQPVAFIHQDLGLVEWMTVTENVALGMGYAKRFGLIDWQAADKRARRVMQRVGCNIDPGRRIFSLTRAEESLLAIGRALEVQARVLVLDEPSASLPMADVERLFGVLRELRRQGMAMIYVSHRLDEVMAISDRAAVMRDGKLVDVKETAKTDTSELVRLIIGKPLSKTVRKAKSDGAGSAVLEMENAASGNAGPLNFSIHEGEVVGLIGLRGAGHEAISRAIFGREPLSAGKMKLSGKQVTFHTSADAIEAGIAYVASERLDENLIPAMSVLENLFPNPTLTGARGLVFDRRKREVIDAMRLINLFDVNPPAPTAEVQQLSGGNQQKVVLARWFNLDKDLVVLEEPTAGVDVGAKRQIYEILRQHADRGTAIAVVSTDFEEVATVCTRVLVFRNGLIAAELEGDSITVENLLTLAAGEFSKIGQEITEMGTEK